MTDFLEQVVAERRADVASAKERLPERELYERIEERRRLQGATRGPLPAATSGSAFALALLQRKREGRLAVIAEVKRVSPALGVLAADADPAGLARRYAAAGATAISVLVEPRHWGGSVQDLAAVREAVAIPVLCKDVVVDEYQLVEACAAGADAVLLIAEALDEATLRYLVERARRLGMVAFVEAHEPIAFGRAVASGAAVVGVNARDLRHPGDIDVGRVRQLHTFARPDQILVAESGIASVDDARLLPARADAVLIGTALMRAADPAPVIQGIAAIRRKVEV